MYIIKYTHKHMFKVIHTQNVKIHGYMYLEHVDTVTCKSTGNIFFLNKIRIL